MRIPGNFLKLFSPVLHLGTVECDGAKECQISLVSTLLFSGKWPLTPSGFQSTAGTTASIALIRNRKLYVGHVGDSAIVVGRCPSDSKDSAIDNWTGNALTVVSYEMEILTFVLL